MPYGPHVNRYHAPGDRPGIVEHIKAAREDAIAEASFKITAVSIFVGGPKNRKITLSPEERESLREYVNETGLRVIAHSSYSAQPWKGDPDAARYIREELEVCQEAGIVGLVVHLPKLPVENVMRYISRLYNPNVNSVRLYLEIPAVRPTESFYETPKKLAKLFTKIREQLDTELNSFGLCLDSAHLWTCGVDMETYEAANSWLRDLESVADIIPPDRIMVHLNDSLREIGVGPDAHAALALGKIWEGYRKKLDKSGIAAITDYAQRHDTPIILERKPKEMLKNDYLILRELIPDTENA